MKRMLFGGLAFLVLAGCTGGPQVKYPIDGLQGNYTVAAYHYWDIVEKNRSVTTYAVTDANNMAEKLRQTGQKAYVADLGGEAIVVVGSYPSLEIAASAANSLGEVLQKTLGLPQVQVNRVGIGSGTTPLVMAPMAVDLKELKGRSQRLRNLRP
jgi:hypothetical protein